MAVGQHQLKSLLILKVFSESRCPDGKHRDSQRLLDLDCRAEVMETLSLELPLKDPIGEGTVVPGRFSRYTRCP